MSSSESTKKSRFRRSRHEETASPTKDSSLPLISESQTVQPPIQQQPVVMQRTEPPPQSQQPPPQQPVDAPLSRRPSTSVYKPNDPISTGGMNRDDEAVSFQMNDRGEEFDDDNDDDDYDDDEDDDLLPLAPKLKKKQAIVPLPNQDVEGQLEKIRRIRKVQRTFPLSFFYKFFKYHDAGYNTESFMRRISFQNAYPNLDLTQHTDGLTIGLTIKSLWSYKAPLVSLVKPFVRIHILDMETGLYLQSRDMPPVKPWNTTIRSVHKMDGSSANWNEEFIIPANLMDIATENTLFLFEILDERPILSMRKRKKKASRSGGEDVIVYKKIAWAYLLPIGLNGRMNIGHIGLHTRTITASPTRKEDDLDSPQTMHVPHDPDALPPLDMLDPSNPIPLLKSTKSVPDLQLKSLSSKMGNEEVNTAPDEQQQQRTVHEVKNIDYAMKLQLYAYREFDGLIGWMQRKILGWPLLTTKYNSAIEDPAYPINVPAIYLQWKLVYKKELPGAFVEIITGTRLKHKDTEDDDYDQEIDNELQLSPRSRMNHPDYHHHYHYYHFTRFHPHYHKKLRKHKTREERNRLRAAVLRRIRHPQEPCIIPNKFLCKLSVGPEGAMVVKFSHSGHLLAIASRHTSRNLPLGPAETIYSLRLYDTDYDEEVWMEEIAHHGVIYDVQWSKNDRYLLTCSSDGCCKIWDFLCFVPLMKQYPAQQIHPFPAAGGGGGEGIQDDGSHMFFDSPSLVGGFGGGGGGGGGNMNLSPRHIGKLHPPKIIQILTQPAGAYTYCGLFQEIGVPIGIPPSVHASNASGFGMNMNKGIAATAGAGGGVNQSMDIVSTWKEQMLVLQTSKVPRILIGNADGKIRVYDNAALSGYVLVHDEDEDGQAQDFSPHDGAVNSLVIDERSRYLLSGDSVGDILAWKLDSNGWYQLLRKFKREYTPMATLFQQTKTTGHGGGTSSTSNNNHHHSSFESGSILSLAVHPNPMKGLMLVLSRQPAVLKVMNMATYKPLSYCEGFLGIASSSFVIREDEEAYSTGVFYHANYSADGRYILCGSSSNQLLGHPEMESNVYKLMVWDTFTGHPVPSELSKLTFPYPIRTVAWHPAQHLLAVAMVGSNAAVVMYCADRDSGVENRVAFQLNGGGPMMLIGNNGNGNNGITGIPRSVSAVSQSVDTIPQGMGGAGGGKEEFQYSILETVNEQQSASSSMTASNPMFPPKQSMDPQLSNTNHSNSITNNSNTNSYSNSNSNTNSNNNSNNNSLNNRTTGSNVLPLMQTKTPAMNATGKGKGTSGGGGSGSLDVGAQLEEKEMKATKARELLAKLRASKAATTVNPPPS